MKTPLTNLLSIAVKKATHNIIRDFSEIDFLLNNPTAALNFAKISNTTAQKIIFDDLMKFKNNYSAIFQNLELFDNKDKSNFFIINGILGIKNFSKGIPNFCISASLERDSKIFASVVFDPIADNLFSAELGSGAYCNNKRIRIIENRVSTSENNIVATDLSHIVTAKKTKSNFYISNCKALDICYLASNKISDCIYKDSSPAYDLLPSLLIANEAGFHFDIKYDETKKEKTIIELSNKDI
jgi:myo-inositol-1(or 4)-monophosphatase